MSENVYEGMFILDSVKYAQNPDAAQKEVLGLLERTHATVLVSRPWQDAKLAYPIDKHKKGLYYLAYFKLDANNLTELNRLCKLNETVIRQLFLKVDPLLVEPLVAMASSVVRTRVSSTIRLKTAPKVVASSAVADGIATVIVATVIANKN